jgi:hypothetical protein
MAMILRLRIFKKISLKQHWLLLLDIKAKGNTLGDFG